MSNTTSSAQSSGATEIAQAAGPTAHPNPEMRAAYLRALATRPAPAWTPRGAHDGRTDIS